MPGEEYHFHSLRHSTPTLLTPCHTPSSPQQSPCPSVPSSTSSSHSLGPPLVYQQGKAPQGLPWVSPVSCETAGPYSWAADLLLSLPPPPGLSAAPAQALGALQAPQARVLPLLSLALHSRLVPPPRDPRTAPRLVTVTQAARYMGREGSAGHSEGLWGGAGAFGGDLGSAPFALAGLPGDSWHQLAGASGRAACVQWVHTRTPFCRILGRATGRLPAPRPPYPSPPPPHSLSLSLSPLTPSPGPSPLPSASSEHLCARLGHASEGLTAAEAWAVGADALLISRGALRVHPGSTTCRSAAGQVLSALASRHPTPPLEKQPGTGPGTPECPPARWLHSALLFSPSCFPVPLFLS